MMEEKALIHNLVGVGALLMALSLITCLAAFCFRNGDFLVLGIFCSSASLGYALAIRGGVILRPVGLEWGLLINYSAYSAIAAYTGLCYLFWMLDWPLSIPAVKNLTMAQTYYASPLAILIALISYLTLIVSIKRRLRGEGL